MQGILSKISEQVRFARKRFGQYEVIDFLTVLFGYAISGERTLEEFYETLQPFAIPFMALFERDRLPSRSALSRFLAVLIEEPVEALRTLFLDDLLARPLTPDKQAGGLVDRTSDTWTVFDIDGTREAARQRALPQTDGLPPAFRRLDDVCAPGYRGRRRGEVVRTRTTVSQAHSYSWLGSFGTRGNGAIGKNCIKDFVIYNRPIYRTDVPSSQHRFLLSMAGLFKKLRCGEITEELIKVNSSETFHPFSDDVLSSDRSLFPSAKNITGFLHNTIPSIIPYIA
ncbi:MAG TPA: hypothetical protein VFN35_14060 [Ktedonobacteraceae bacterium]|nr:hypothetical protein [Ktedonobacteraceae bacterium]